MYFLKIIASKLPASLQRWLRLRHYARKLASATIESDAELRVVTGEVSQGDVVLDIGANFGLFSRFLAEAVTDSGAVYSFEPTRDMFEVLSSNIEKLGLGQVTCINAGLSDEPGATTITIPRRADGTLNYYEASVDESDNGVGEVQQITLTTVDLFCRERGLNRLDFIKCDVEGHELAVLTGAAETIKRWHPKIFLEVNEPLAGNSHGEAVRSLIESLGYQIHVADESGQRLWEPGMDRINYLLVPEVQRTDPTTVTADVQVSEPVA